MVGWVNKGQIIDDFQNVLLIIMILFSIKYIKSSLLLKIKVIKIPILIFFLYNTFCALNPYIDASLNKLLIKINLDSIKSLEEKQRSLIYSDILENLEKVNENDSSTSFALNIEIDRTINSGEILVSRIINYHLHFVSSPFLPASIFLGQMGYHTATYLLLTLLIPVIITAEIKNRKTLFRCFYILAISSFILATIGIYLRFLYLNGLINFEDKGLWLWAPSEPRIFFSSFSYKNHWSAYAILILSIVFTLIPLYTKNSRIGFLRNNSVVFLTIVSLIIISSVFYSNSNSGIILTSFLTLISILFYNRNILLQKKFYLLFFPALAVGSFFFLQTDVFQRVYDLIKGSSFRFYLWNDILNQIQIKTFWGYGINSYKAINGIFQSFDVTSARHQNLINAHQFYIPLTLHAHSDFLQITSEIGFFGLCLVVFPIFFLILRSLLLYSENPLPLISSGLFTILIYSVVDFPFRNIAVIIMFLFLLTLCETQMKFFNRNS